MLYKNEGCKALTSINIPSSVTSIGRYAFLKCTKLQEINCFNTTPPTIKDATTFDGVVKKTCKLNVPQESISAYKAADYWKEFFNIQPLDPSGINTTVADTCDKASKQYTISGSVATEGYKGIVIKDGKKVMQK